MITGDAKSALRAQMRDRFRMLTPEERRAASLRVCQRVLNLPVWKNARVTAAFEPLRSEPEITSLLDDVRRRGGELVVILPTARKHEDVVIIAPIDLVLVPGVAFTRDGDRMGRGGGFFDRFLAQRAAQAVKIGLGFQFQIVDSLPLESHDVKLDLVVTD